MARTFAVVAVLTLLMLIGNFVVGLQIGDFNAAAQRKRETHQRLGQLERQPRTSRPTAEFEQAKHEADDADAAFAQPRWRMTLHMLLGSAAAMLTVFVCSLSITYFIGTSRWCKEVCETFHLRPELAERSLRLKRGAFPWALAAIVTVIVVIALGAAADPSGANWPRSAHFVISHYLMSMTAIVIVMAAFWVQISHIAENYGVIEEVMAEVQRIRAASESAVEEPIGR